MGRLPCVQLSSIWRLAALHGTKASAQGRAPQVVCRRAYLGHQSTVQAFGQDGFSLSRPPRPAACLHCRRNDHLIEGITFLQVVFQQPHAALPLCALGTRTHGCRVSGLHRGHTLHSRKRFTHNTTSMDILTRLCNTLFRALREVRVRPMHPTAVLPHRSPPSYWWPLSQQERTVSPTEPNRWDNRLVPPRAESMYTGHAKHCIW